MLAEPDPSAVARRGKRLSPSPKYTRKFVIRNDLADLAILSEALERIGAERGVPPKPLMQIQVALDEVASNVIKYGWPEGGAHELLVRISVRDDGVEIEVVDDGQMFDPRLAPPPNPAPAGRQWPGGVGVHMMKQLVDGIEYARIDGRNHLTLTKRCPVSAPPTVRSSR